MGWWPRAGVVAFIFVVEACVALCDGNCGWGVVFCCVEMDSQGRPPAAALAGGKSNEEIEEFNKKVCELIDAQDANHLEARSEEHTSELQSLMRISYAVFCLTNTKKN